MKHSSSVEHDIQNIFQQVAARLPLRLPVSTYRLQFNRDFTLKQAEELLPFLQELGITDIYASPVLKAQPGSVHGYDITDYRQLNSEIGTETDFRRFTNELRQLGMGLVLDIVPNHMSIGGSENPWWLDILENGAGSPYAPYFDIDWKPLKEELADKVLLPILGDQYGRILENQELQLVFEGGGFRVDYYHHRFPLDPKTYTQVLRYRLDGLEQTLGKEDPLFQELLSIVTGLTHLPARQVTKADKVSERRREKEILKKRLLDLYESSEPVRAHLDDNVRIFNGRPHDPGSFDLLDQLLADQAFRLSYWRVATEEINYRRFFDINDLAAIRMEHPAVFREAHELVCRWLKEERITGLRVDHPDGLYDPTTYFRKLQEECFVQLCLALLGREEEAAAENFRKLYSRHLYDEGYELKRPVFVVGEKILMDREPMPPYWPIYGATGYVFMNQVNGLFVNQEQARAFTRLYGQFAKVRRTFSSLLRENKKLIMNSSMASEINTLGRSLNHISENDRYFRDFTLNDLTRAIVEVIAFFPIYRTYIDERGVSDRDQHYLETTIAKAKRHSRGLSGSIFDFLKDVLMLRYPGEGHEAIREQVFDFSMKFQQLTGPVMAKGMEDTAFYIYNRLVSLNEVGGNPEKFGTTVEEFHQDNQKRAANWPHTLLATSTHDSKRGEDVRARISVLSELPDQWHDHLVTWGRRNQKWKTEVDGAPAPDRNDEYLLYQTLLGAWPFAAAEATGQRFKERLKHYMLKAVREAKVNTSWINQNVEYEEALTSFVDRILSARSFLDSFLPFQRHIAHYGIFNSLAQLLLKIGSPGTPDFFQGTELWTLTLVDPDNRTPVDYKIRARLLAQLKKQTSTMSRLPLLKKLLSSKEDGRLKMFTTWKALRFRMAHAELLQQASYLPLQPEGAWSRQVIGFCRTFGEDFICIVVPRLLTSMIKPPELPLGDIWQDTFLRLPDSAASLPLRNLFTDQLITPHQAGGQAVLRLQDVFAHFPVALLLPAERR